MTSPFTSPDRPDDHPRLRTARNALIWVAVLVLALYPFPWWGF